MISNLGGSWIHPFESTGHCFCLSEVLELDLMLKAVSDYMTPLYNLDNRFPRHSTRSQFSSSERLDECGGEWDRCSTHMGHSFGFQDM